MSDPISGTSRVLVLVHVLGTRRDVSQDPGAPGGDALLKAIDKLERTTAQRVKQVVAIELPSGNTNTNLATAALWKKWSQRSNSSNTAAKGRAPDGSLTAYRARTPVDDAHDPTQVRDVLAGAAERMLANGTDARKSVNALLESVLALSARAMGRRDVVISSYAGTLTAWSVLVEEIVERLIAARCTGDRVFLLVPGPSKGAEPRLVLVRAIRAEDPWASPGWLLARAREIPADVPVLLLGESGSGKSQHARALHEAWWPASETASSKKAASFRVVNAASLSPALASAELFGAEQGAFTGATRASEGVFGAFSTSRGTLFLDEVGELPTETQAQLLTALDPRKNESGTLGWNIRRVGATAERSIPVDNLRIVLATNRDLRNGNDFRADLLARIGAVQVSMPPLNRARHRVIPAWITFVRNRLGPRSARVIFPRDMAHELASVVFDEANDLQRNYRGVQDAALRTAMQCASAKGEGSADETRVSAADMRAGLAAMIAPRGRRSATDTATAEVPKVEREIRAPLHADDPLPLDKEFEDFSRKRSAQWSLLERYEAWLLWSAWKNSRSAAQAWVRIEKSRAFSTDEGSTSNPSDAFARRYKRLYGELPPRR